MNFIELLLSEKLKDRKPTLKIFGSDRKVLQIACRDLANYLKVLWNLVGKEANDCEVVERLEKIFNENQDELQEFLDVWAGIWLRKWEQRVKLTIGRVNSKRWNRTTTLLSKAEPTWAKLRNRQEIEDLVVSTLIRNGEICGTSILAENLLKMEIAREKKGYSNDGEQVLNVVNNTLRKARELTQSKGPLIFVKVDKGYYDSTST